MTTVKLENGKFLQGKERQSVLNMVHNNLEKIDYDGNTITLVEKKKTDKECVIVVRVS